MKSSPSKRASRRPVPCFRVAPLEFLCVCSGDDDDDDPHACDGHACLDLGVMRSCNHASLHICTDSRARPVRASVTYKIYFA